MFAVKGWAVDPSSLRPQTDVFKVKGSGPQSEPQQESKKRKREGESVHGNEDIAKLWDRHVEGKPGKSKGQAKRERKRQRVEEEKTGTSGKRPSEQTAQIKVDPIKDANIGDVFEKKSKSHRKKDNRKDQRKDMDSASNPNMMPVAMQKDEVTRKSASKAPLPPATKLTPMQAAMRQKLISARFRHLNQTLYTKPSAKALELFDQNPEMFEDYHSGFRQQVSVWPENPVDSFITTIRKRGGISLPSQKKMFKSKKRSTGPVESLPATDRSVTPLPRTHGTCIIADLGCGDARLAQTLKESGEGQKLQVKVLSYDLHSPSPLVTKADISNVPSADGSVDVAIFCLALMGTNWISFIEEAYRILHWKGELWVAEIKSRFGRVGRTGKPVEHSVGGKRKQAALKKARDVKEREQEEVNEQEVLQAEVDEVPVANQETDVSSFIEVLKRRGFILKEADKSIDLANKMFVRMEFVKAAAPIKGKSVADTNTRPLAKFKSKAKFIEDDANEVATDDEAKVLKPCLYKIR